MRLFLIVVGDPTSSYESAEELESDLRHVWDDYGLRGEIKAVRRGGLLALKVLEELPPVRHEHMGRPRG